MHNCTFQTLLGRDTRHSRLCTPCKKKIKNKPEVNQKMMKSTLIKDLYSEIDCLKQEANYREAAKAAEQLQFIGISSRGDGAAAAAATSGQPRRHLLQSGWSVFVSSKRLVAGDAFIFLRGENGELRVGVRRAMRRQSNVPSSVISSHSMHLGVLATAWHAISTGTMFTVYYKPRTSPSEFIVPFNQYMESVKNSHSIGMRFKMRFEGEEAPEQRFTGTIVGIGDVVSNKWPGSKWRCLKVRWDETSSIPRPERVSPWKIEPALIPPALNPLATPRSKRSRATMVPSSPDSSVLTREGTMQFIVSNIL